MSTMTYDTLDSTRSNRKSRKDRKEKKSGAKSTVKDKYKIPKLILEDQQLKKAESTVRKTPGIDDYLLEDISEVQREYIIKELYPLLK